MTTPTGEERVEEIRKRLHDANRIGLDDAEYLLARVRELEGELAGFKELADDYWNQLVEINHERNLFRDKLAQAEQRVVGLEAELDSASEYMRVEDAMRWAKVQQARRDALTPSPSGAPGGPDGE